MAIIVAQGLHDTVAMLKGQSLASVGQDPFVRPDSLPGSAAKEASIGVLQQEQKALRRDHRPFR